MAEPLMASQAHILQAPAVLRALRIITQAHCPKGSTTMSASLDCLSEMVAELGVKQTPHELGCLLLWMRRYKVPVTVRSREHGGYNYRRVMLERRLADFDARVMEDEHDKVAAFAVAKPILKGGLHGDPADREDR